jgi:hypothetical protein
VLPDDPLESDDDDEDELLESESAAAETLDAKSITNDRMRFNVKAMFVVVCERGADRNERGEKRRSVRREDQDWCGK